MNTRPIVLLFIFFIITVPDHAFPARKNSTELYREASKLAVSGKIDDAIPVFQESVKTNPYYSMGHYGLGKAYLHRKGKIRDGIRHLEKAVRLDKKNAKAYFYLGLGYYIDRKYVPSIHAFSLAYQRDSTYFEALYNIGAIYDIMGYEGKAMKYFDLFYVKKEKVDLDILF